MKPLAPDWVIRNAERAVVVLGDYAALMRLRGIPLVAHWADAAALEIRDQLAGRKAFPDYPRRLRRL